MITIAIDPGENTGFAVFMGTTLIEATALPHRFALYKLRDELALRNFERTPARLIGERPQVYASGKSKADPNDLITLALKMGAFFGVAEMHGAQHHAFEPAAWKRQLPKHVAALRIKERLTYQECEAVRNLNALSKTMVHNAIDAIGIGLHFLGRGILARE